MRHIKTICGGLLKGIGATQLSGRAGALNAMATVLSADVPGWIPLLPVQLLMNKCN